MSELRDLLAEQDPSIQLVSDRPGVIRIQKYPNTCTGESWEEPEIEAELVGYPLQSVEIRYGRTIIGDRSAGPRTIKIPLNSSSLLAEVETTLAKALLKNEHIVTNRPWSGDIDIESSNDPSCGY